MQALRKHALPAVVSITAAISTQVNTQGDRSSFVSPILPMGHFQVQASTVYLFKA